MLGAIHQWPVKNFNVCFRPEIAHDLLKVVSAMIVKIIDLKYNLIAIHAATNETVDYQDREGFEWHNERTELYQTIMRELNLNLTSS